MIECCVPGIDYIIWGGHIYACVNNAPHRKDVNSSIRLFILDCLSCTGIFLLRPCHHVKSVVIIYIYKY